MDSVIWYLPNLINYFRSCLIIVAAFTLKNRPILTFILIISAGLIDDFDGPISRSLGQTSKFGANMDLIMDRFTAMMQIVFLASVYPKYWLLFATVQFTEIFGDYLNSTAQVYSEQTRHYIQKSDRKFLLQNQAASANEPEQAFFNFYPLIWYLGDLFYWVIYFGYFTSNSIKFTMNDQNQTRSFKESLKHNLEIASDKIDTIISTAEDRFSILKSPIRLFKIRLVLKCLCFACLVAAFLDFYLNFKSLCKNFGSIIENDYKMNLMKKV